MAESHKEQDRSLVRAEPHPAQPVCWYSFWHLLMLDNPLRCFLQDPEKILKGYIRPGMQVLDIGCGPGNFTRAMRKMVGPRGHVIVVDLQEEMLRYAKQKCGNTGPFAPVTWHQCGAGSLGLATQVDFALAFYMVHEVPDQERLIGEIHSLLKPGGTWLLVEPVFHVTDSAFTATLDCTEQAGFVVHERPHIPLSRAVELQKPPFS